MPKLLSTHFTQEELVISQEAARREIDNQPPGDIVLKSIWAGVVLLVLSACANLNPGKVEINPPSIHRSADKAESPTTGTPTTVVTNAAQAQAIPVDDYYSALTLAHKSPKDPAAVADYVAAGVTLVNSHCLRWFQYLSEQDLRKSFADENNNIIRALGTAFLGVGHASAAIVTTYGASNTAFEGYSKNFGNSFLLAPTSRKVKAQVMSLLDNRAAELLDKHLTELDPAKRGTIDKTPQTFTEAYRQLERFADLCTHSTAKEIVNSALDQSEAKATPDGKITLTPTDTALKAASTTLSTEKAKVDEDKKSLDAANAKVQEAVASAQKQSQTLLDSLKTALESMAKQAADISRFNASAAALNAQNVTLQDRLNAAEAELKKLQESK